MSVGTAIVRTEFLGITSLVRRRSLHVLICAALATVVAVAVVGGLAAARWWDWPAPRTAMGAGLVVSFGALLIRPWLTRRAERLLLADAYDPADVTLQLSAALSQATPYTLGPLAVTHLVTIFNLEFAALLTNRDTYLQTHTRNLVPSMDLERITHRAQTLLGEPSVIQPIMETVASVPVLLLPIGDDQRVQAVLCCGPKHSGDAYTRQDRALLHAFSHYLALRFEYYPQGAAMGMLLPVPCEDTTLAMQPAGAPLLGEPLAVPLTRRELLVLRLLAQGLGNRQIAEQLERDVDTIEKQVKNIRRKLGVRAVADAVAIARQHGLLAPE